jgi:hypothetical protein
MLPARASGPFPYRGVPSPFAHVLRADHQSLGRVAGMTNEAAARDAVTHGYTDLPAVRAQAASYDGGFV